MQSRRLVLISRRFWPLVGGAERAMAGLAQEFQKMGHQVRVVTAKWESHWPAELVHREIPVTRLANPKTRGWGTYRYISGLKRWLGNHRLDYDAVLVSMLKHDAYAAIGTLGRFEKPVVVRAEGAGSTGDCSWHRTARFGTRIKNVCKTASAMVAPSRRVEEELLESGFDSSKVHYVPNGVELVDFKSDGAAAARFALADAHPILKVEPGEPLVVYTGRLDIQKGLLDLVDAWKWVAKAFPRGRLWLVGEGPDGQVIWDRIRESNQTCEVVMPGSFDEVTDVLAAADAFVLPSYQEGMSLSLLEAMAAEVPVVATDIPGNRALIGDHRGRTCRVKDPEDLARAILDTIQKSDQSHRMAKSARQYVEENYSLSRMAQKHLELIERQLSPSQGRSVPLEQSDRNSVDSNPEKGL